MLAGTDTTIWRPFGKTEAGASGVPSRTTCDPETKPEPVIVSVTAAVGEVNVIPGLDSTICNALIAAPSETVERLPLPPGAPGLRTNAWLLAGSIASIGSQYLIGLKAVNCQTGDTLASTEAQAENRDKVLKALGDAGNQLREKLGESLASVEKYNKPLEQATTSSLEALKAFTEGHRMQLEKTV